jgi:Ubiquitin family
MMDEKKNENKSFYTIVYLNKLYLAFKMATKYIIVRDNLCDRNIICSYTDENITTEHLENMIYNYFDKGDGDISDRSIVAQSSFGYKINKFKNVNEIFEHRKNDPQYKNHCGIPHQLQDRVIKLLFSYKSKKYELEKKALEEKRKKALEDEMKKLAEKMQKEKKENQISFFCRTLTGKNIAIMANKNETVEQLKMHIQNREGIPCDQIRFVYTGKQLEDGYTLDSYNIRDDVVIHIVMRLKGGMFLEITSGNIDYENISNVHINIDLDKEFKENSKEE